MLGPQAGMVPESSIDLEMQARSYSQVPTPKLREATTVGTCCARENRDQINQSMTVRDHMLISQLVLDEIPLKLLPPIWK